MKIALVVTAMVFAVFASGCTSIQPPTAEQVDAFQAETERQEAEILAAADAEGRELTDVETKLIQTYDAIQADGDVARMTLEKIAGGEAPSPQELGTLGSTIGGVFGPAGIAIGGAVGTLLAGVWGFTQNRRRHKREDELRKVLVGIDTAHNDERIDSDRLERALRAAGVTRAKKS